MKTKITIVRDFTVTVQGRLNGMMIPKGTVLLSEKLLNNGSAFMSYECRYNDQTVFVKPTIGYVISEEVR